jgi:hypothetical protein
MVDMPFTNNQYPARLYKIMVVFNMETPLLRYFRFHAQVTMTTDNSTVVPKE